MQIDQFREAIRAAGLNPPEAIEPGKFIRFPGEGKGRSNDAGWCKLFEDGTGGTYGDFSTGLSADWQAEQSKPLSPTEIAAFKRSIAEAREQADAERKRQQADAAQRAAVIWRDAQPAPADHGYLARKGIQPHGLRIAEDGRLIVPMYADGTLQSVQRISEDGGKRFLTGGRVGGCYYPIGKPDGVLCIAEGFATGACIHEATGYAVAVAFNAGNLEPVARALRAKYPDLRLIVCADDDHRTESNPGLSKATEAAQAVGGSVAVPVFGVDRQEGATDFNDLHLAQGLEAVASCIEAALSGEVEQPEQDDEPARHRSERFDFGGGCFQVDHKGVFFVESNEDNAPEYMPLCGPVRVLAATRDAKSGEWGRLLEWRDADGVRHQWAMPLELLQADGVDVRRELARQGLTISPGQKSRNLLSTFLQVWPVEARARCVDRLGWHGGVYVTSQESVGQEDEVVVFQNAHSIEPAFSVSGSVEAWRGSVARLAAGNSRLVFALSVAFAGPLADVVGEDSGGFHFRGASSSGKSTALKVAASVWGSPDTYPRLWRATANGLEGLAALHNDGLLILDELSQIDPREAGESAYLLANGQGKARASRSGTARQSARWRLLFLSAGEESLTGLMARAGKKTNAGQEIRLAVIEADAGAGMGAFETLHDQLFPAALAESVKLAAGKHHGAVGVEWLRRIVADRPALVDLLADSIRQFVAAVVPDDAAGQVLRVARRFGLVAAAGELASHYGLTGWPEGESISAARKCFAAWLEGFGGAGNRETRAILDQMRAFFEAHGASRFEDVADTTDKRIINRAGYFRTTADGRREYLVLPESFKREICQGFDQKAVTAVLLAAGWVTPGTDGKTAQKPHIPGVGRPRCYVFNSTMWEYEHEI